MDKLIGGVKRYTDESRPMPNCEYLGIEKNN